MWSLGTQFNYITYDSSPTDGHLYNTLFHFTLIKDRHVHTHVYTSWSEAISRDLPCAYFKNLQAECKETFDIVQECAYK